MTDHDVLVAGETLIDFLPDSTGPLSAVETFARRAGGAPANVAVALARLDRVPLLWTRVGEDPFGDFLVETLSEYGLPDRFLERDPRTKTSLAFVSHDEDADRQFAFYRDDTADTRMRSGRVPDETLANVSWVHAGGVTLAAGTSRSATQDLLERAGEHDCTVSFDPNERPELWRSRGAYEQVVGEAIEDVDVLKATAAELRGLGIDGEGPESLARNACEHGPHTTLLTLGEDGSLAVATPAAPWVDGEQSVTVTHRGYAVDPVDTTGAGDAFLAGAVAALVDGDPLEEVLSFANAVAATATTAVGAMEALPDRAAVTELREATDRA